MGLIGNFFTMLFGDGRNIIAETAHVFRENAEAGAARNADISSQVMAQFGTEFGLKKRGFFDTLMDAVNRIPRPAMALGTLALFVSAMVDPVWFAARMQGLALVPEPLWWLLGAIVSFYFGARHQLKTQEFQSSVAAAIALAPSVTGKIEVRQDMTGDSPGVADTGTDAALASAMVQPEEGFDDNPALDAWRRESRRKESQSGR
jgi:hypothetical protein